MECAEWYTEVNTRLRLMLTMWHGGMCECTLQYTFIISLSHSQHSTSKWAMLQDVVRTRKIDWRYDCHCNTSCMKQGHCRTDRDLKYNCHPLRSIQSPRTATHNYGASSTDEHKSLETMKMIDVIFLPVFSYPTEMSTRIQLSQNVKHDHWIWPL